MKRGDFMKQNYQLILDKIIAEVSNKEKVPTLLLHSCCAPCSSYPLEYLSNFFKITIFYYNPNIYPSDEYYKRRDEQKEFIIDYGITIIKLIYSFK